MNADRYPLYLAIDQGGHASRVLVFDAEGNEQAAAFASIETYHPRQDWVEHDPEQLVASVQQALADVCEQLGAEAGAIRAAGLASQRSSLVCWDRRSGEALSPVISWQDRRAAAMLDELVPRQERIRAITGLFPSPHYGASKLRWCLDHLPSVRHAAKAGYLAMGPLSSFLVFRLLRERPFVVDPANASRTLLLDRDSGDWSQELLALFGIAAKHLPRLVWTRHSFGCLAGIKGDIPLTVCTGDQSAALFADGMPQWGVAYVNAGTGAFVQTRTGASAVCDQRLLQSTVYRDEFLRLEVLEGTVNGADLALRWWRGRHPVADFETRLEQWLERENEPPLFLNTVAGVGSPFWVAGVQPRFQGRDSHDVAAQAVAVVESIVFLLRANLEAMAVCAAPREIVLTGGLANSEGFCRRLQAAAGVPVWRVRQREATARGLAFLLAGRPSAWRASPRQAVAARAVAGMEQRYHRWLAAMRALG